MGRTGWVATTYKASPWARQNGRTKGRWKSRAVEKSKNRLSHRAWKSRKVRGIPSFPPARRLLEINETGHFTCYQKRTSSLANNTVGSGLWKVCKQIIHKTKRPRLGLSLRTSVDQPSPKCCSRRRLLYGSEHVYGSRVPLANKELARWEPAAKCRSDNALS